MIPQPVTLPHSDEAERAVLAAVLVDARVMQRAVGVLEVGDFYWEKHQRIFTVMRALDEEGSAIDTLTLQAALELKGELDGVGGLAYLAGLDDDLPDLSGFDSYVAVVLDRSLRRRLIHLASELSLSCLDGSGRDGVEVLTSTELQLRKLAERAVPDEAVSLGEAVSKVLEAAEEREGRGPLGLSTGFPDVDSKIHGLRPGNLVCIAGRPGSGKTSIAMQFAGELAIRKGAPVGIFSIEMSADELATRVLCTEADVSHSRLLEGYLSARQWRTLVHTAQRISGAPLLIDDDGGLDLVRLVARARRWRAEAGIQLLLIDHLNLLTGGERRYENRTLEVATITRGLKKLAKELGIPIVMLSQLNRQGASRSDHRPKLEDLRESGTTEQDCDAVLFIYREELHSPNDPSVRGLAEVIVAKNRNGATGTVELAWIGETFSFKNLARGWQQAMETVAGTAPSPEDQRPAGPAGPGDDEDPWTTEEIADAST